MRPATRYDDVATDDRPTSGPGGSPPPAGPVDPYGWPPLETENTDHGSAASRRRLIVGALGTLGLAGVGGAAALSTGLFGGPDDAAPAGGTDPGSDGGAPPWADAPSEATPAASGSSTPSPRSSASSPSSERGVAGAGSAAGAHDGSSSGGSSSIEGSSGGSSYRASGSGSSTGSSTEDYTESYTGKNPDGGADPVPQVSGPRLEIEPETGLPHGKAPSRDSGSTSPGASRGGSSAPVAVPVSLAELVIRRASYGPTPQLRADVAAMGVGAWLGRQLAPAGLADPAGDAVASRFSTLRMSPLAIKKRYDAKNTKGFDPRGDLQGAHLGRAVHSSRQLLEVMVAFWSDHFTVPLGAQDARYFRAHYDSAVIRPHALGRFEDMLVAVTYSGAMLQYLNLNGSTGENPNENFARELLELHTVGITGDYTETDIKEAARLLTGWRIDRDTMKVEFRPKAHYVGPAKVMGFSHANASADAGPDAARDLLAYLAHHRSTATHLATKLARHFVSDSPPAALVASLADVYLANDTQIAPVLRALFSSKEFAASGGAKLRRPMEHLVAVARSLGLKPGSDPDALVGLAKALGPAGHAPFDWPTPDGYPDVAGAWQGAGQALRQFSLAADLVQGRREGAFAETRPEDALSDTAAATTPAAMADQLCRRLFGRAPTAAETASVTTLLTGPGAPTSYSPGSDRQRTACALALVLLLHSPAFLTH